MKIIELKHHFTRLLLQWHKLHNKREMPWKGETNPYKIWLSEIILQQTRVEQGLEYYNRFIKKYPNIKLLADAEESEVFKLWEGLGYYSRCKNLIATARFISNDLKNFFPAEYSEILKLKGVGPYTAAAISSFAYNLPHAVVDGNVSRVLARFFKIAIPIDSTKGKIFFAHLATELLDKANPAFYNQAIMDFGATVCKPRLPLCNTCILQKHCGAFASSRVNELPVKEKKLLKKQRWIYYIMAEYKGKLAVRKRFDKDIWQNLYEFILIEEDKKCSPLQIFETGTFRQSAGKNYIILETSAFYTQQLTHQTINGFFIHLRFIKKPNLSGYMFLTPEELSKL
ncbi:MAG: A/G-specific adenine glycosylase, partial [Ferruginibacter sp.]